MANFLLHAHSGLRYLVLLAALVALAALAYALAARRDVPATRGLTTAFVVILDVQLLLGLALIVTGIWYPALIGHLALMLLALAVAHVASVRARRSADPRQAVTLRLVAVAVPLLLVMAGILAIRPSIFA
jgi:hypothetical protein